MTPNLSSRNRTGVRYAITVRAQGGSGALSSLLRLAEQCGTQVQGAALATHGPDECVSAVLQSPSTIDVSRWTELLTPFEVDFRPLEFDGSASEALERAHTVTVFDGPNSASVVGGLESAIIARGGTIRNARLLRVDDRAAYELDVRNLPRDELRHVVLAERARHPGVDLGFVANALRRGQRLVVFDVDSTFLRGEMIDDLAYANERAAECSALTAKAMRGDVDFADALRERVALLAGLPLVDAMRVAEQVVPADGAEYLLGRLRSMGFRTAVVSGGFTFVTNRLRMQFRLDHAAANELEVERGVLTGRICGEIIDRAAKARWVRRFAEAEGIPLEHVVAVGDGANDLDMLEAVGLGVAYCAKPAVHAVADATISEERLDLLLGHLSLGVPTI